MTIQSIVVNDRIIHAVSVNGPFSLPAPDNSSATDAIRVAASTLIPATVQDVTIPITPAAALDVGETVPTVISNVPGLLSRTGAGYTFTRYRDGSAVTVADNTRVLFSPPVALGPFTNGLNIDAQGLLNLGDGTVVKQEAERFNINDNFIIEGDATGRLSINDGAGNTLFNITTDGKFQFPNGLVQGEANTVDFGSLTDCFNIFVENKGSYAKVEQDGTLVVPWGLTSDGLRIVFDDNEIFSIHDRVGPCLRLTREGVLQVARLEAESHNLTVGGNPQTTELAWNQSNAFWDGYAPMGVASSSYDRLVNGSASTSEADDVAYRQNFLCQRATKAVRAYFDHSSDHFAQFYAGGSAFAGAPTTMELSWGVGKATNNDPAAASGASEFYRGSINGEVRPTVDLHFSGWTDPIYIDVTEDTTLTVGTACNIQGAFRLSSAQGASGTNTYSGHQGGFLAAEATRWKANVDSPAAAPVTGENDGTGGFRFLAIERAINKMVCIVSDSIARGIIYTMPPNPFLTPVTWGGLLESVLADDAAVWMQGQGGSRIAAWGTNDRWFNRTTNCTHLILTQGSNDIADNRSAVDMQNFITPRVAILQDLGIKVMLATVIPRNGFNAAQNTQKTAYNTWVKTDPFGNGFFDFHDALEGTTDQLDPIYDGGDGIHPNNAAHSVMFNVVNAKIALLN